MSSKKINGLFDSLRMYIKTCELSISMMTDGKIGFYGVRIEIEYRSIDASPSITSAQWIIELLGTHP